MSYLNIKNVVIAVFGVSLFYLVFFTSCANVGSPTGGARDTIPPVVLKTVPKLGSVNFDGADIRLTFNEYIVSDEIAEKLVISPPMKKKPVIKMKGKTLIVEFQERLKKGITYSIDFKDAVADNNEKNPIKELRFSFSTGPTLDSLRVAGFVRKAFDQEPVDKATVLLHRLDNYTAFIDSVPDYIGKTDKEGAFLIDNIAPGAYRLYALDDSDNSLTYNSASELIAFADSLIVPSARYVALPDTIVNGQDTIVVAGHTDYSPGLQYLMMFEEIKFDQYIDSYKRSQRNKCDFYFAEPTDSVFSVNLIKPEAKKNWSYIESNLKRDSISVWITDTVIGKSDSLKFELTYHALDSLHNMVVKRDTLDMIYSDPKVAKSKKKKSELPKYHNVTLSSNINPSAHDLFRDIIIEAPEPFASLDSSKVWLYFIDDTVRTRINAPIKRDINSDRKYHLKYEWEPDASYTFRIDSAAAYNIFGDANKKYEQKFKTQKQDYYGQIFLDLSGLDSPAIVQLLGAEKEEKVLQKIQVLGNGKIEFPFLKPDKYKIKLILDKNKNGKWDTGYLAKGLQPEEVIYFPKIIKVRSNFEFKESWDVSYKPDYKKVIVDEEQEKEKARKKEQERKAREEDRH